MKRLLSLSAHGSRWLPIAVLPVVAVLVFFACKSKGRQDTSNQQRDTLESVGKEIALAFPAGAKLLGVHRERGADDLVAVKVEMSAADWPSFLARTPIDPTLFRPGERGLLGPDDGFWDPHKAKNLRTAEAPLPNGRVLNIGYDDSRGSYFGVFVVNHGT